MFYIVLSLIGAVSLYVGGSMLGNTLHKKDVYFKKIYSDNIPYWELIFYGERVVKGLLKFCNSEHDKQLILSAVKKMIIIVRDKPFNPYGAELPGSARIFVSKNLQVHFVGEGNWRPRYARALAHAFKYALSNDADANMEHAAWFALAVRQVSLENVN